MRRPPSRNEATTRSTARAMYGSSRATAAGTVWSSALMRDRIPATSSVSRSDVRGLRCSVARRANSSKRAGAPPRERAEDSEWSSMTGAACHAAGEPRNAGPPATREPDARGLPLSLEHGQLLLAHEARRAHLVEVDPGRNRPPVVVQPVPGDVVLAGRELAIGEDPHLPPRGV